EESVSVLPSADTVIVPLYIGLPSFFHVASKPRSPAFASVHVQPAGHMEPVAGWSLPSSFASQTPPSLTYFSTSPSLPFVAISRTPGELILTFLVFHFPAKPWVPETR